MKNNGDIEQLMQCATATWDGNLIDKSARDRLVKHGLLTRIHGYNVVTQKGLEYLVELRLLVP